MIARDKNDEITIPLRDIKNLKSKGIIDPVGLIDMLLLNCCDNIELVNEVLGLRKSGCRLLDIEKSKELEMVQ